MRKSGGSIASTNGQDLKAQMARLLRVNRYRYPRYACPEYLYLTNKTCAFLRMIVKPFTVPLEYGPYRFIRHFRGKDLSLGK